MKKNIIIGLVAILIVSFIASMNLKKINALLTGTVNNSSVQIVNKPELIPNTKINPRYLELIADIEPGKTKKSDLESKLNTKLKADFHPRITGLYEHEGVYIKVNPLGTITKVFVYNQNQYSYEDMIAEYGEPELYYENSPSNSNLEAVYPSKGLSFVFDSQNRSESIVLFKPTSVFGFKMEYGEHIPYYREK